MNSNIRIDEIRDVNRTKDAAIPRKIEPISPLTLAVWEIINDISPRGPVDNPQRSASFRGTRTRISMNVNISAFEKIATIEMRRAIGSTEIIIDGSIDNPIETKNTVAKRFLIGIIDVKTSLYCIVAVRIVPARKAPINGERPMEITAYDKIRQNEIPNAKELPVNNFSIRVKILGIKKIPAANMTMIETSTFTMEIAKSVCNADPLCI